MYRVIHDLAKLGYISYQGNGCLLLVAKLKILIFYNSCKLTESPGHRVIIE